MRFKGIAVCLAALSLAGCAVWRFSPLRSSRFVSENNEYLLVDYGRDEKEFASHFTLGNGMRLPFSSKLKVRVELPDGTRFVAWQHMTSVGMLYKTPDGEWEYLESGTNCIVARREKDGGQYVPRFVGVLCANVRNPENVKKDRIRNGNVSPR